MSVKLRYLMIIQDDDFELKLYDFPAEAQLYDIQSQKKFLIKDIYNATLAKW